LRLKVTTKNARPLKDRKVKILDKSGSVVVEKNTDEQGNIKVQLPEYSVKGKERLNSSPYTIITGDAKKELVLDKNADITLVAK
jgi:uncharacterized protein YfaS (alpha-2-macroglobulin family)